MKFCLKVLNLQEKLGTLLKSRPNSPPRPLTFVSGGSGGDSAAGEVAFESPDERGVVRRRMTCDDVLSLSCEKVEPYRASTFRDFLLSDSIIIIQFAQRKFVNRLRARGLKADSRLRRNFRKNSYLYNRH